jgi:hypothetical protein
MFEIAGKNWPPEELAAEVHTPALATTGTVVQLCGPHQHKLNR